MEVTRAVARQAGCAVGARLREEEGLATASSSRCYQRPERRPCSSRSARPTTSLVPGSGSWTLMSPQSPPEEPPA